MNDGALTLPQLKAEIEAVKGELKAEIEVVKAELDTAKTELKAEISRLDVKIDGVKIDLERKLDDRTAEILGTIRETAEMIDTRQERRLSAALVAQRQWLQLPLDRQIEPLRIDHARTRDALDRHVRDDTRHLKPRAPKKAR